MAGRMTIALRFFGLAVLIGLAAAVVRIATLYLFDGAAASEPGRLLYTASGGFADGILFVLLFLGLRKWLGRQHS